MELCDSCKKTLCEKNMEIVKQGNLVTIRCKEYEKDASKIYGYKKLRWSWIYRRSKAMLEVLAIILIIIFSPVILIAGFISLVIILGLIYFIISLILEGIKRIAKIIKKQVEVDG